jgi:hypothetical protein
MSYTIPLPVGRPDEPRNRSVGHHTSSSLAYRSQKLIQSLFIFFPAVWVQELHSFRVVSEITAVVLIGVRSHGCFFVLVVAAGAAVPLVGTALWRIALVIASLAQLRKKY